MGGRSVHIWDIAALKKALDEGKSGDEVEPWQTRESSLKFMTRAVKIMPNEQGVCPSVRTSSFPQTDLALNLQATSRLRSKAVSQSSSSTLHRTFRRKSTPSSATGKSSRVSTPSTPSRVSRSTQCESYFYFSAVA